MTEAIGDACLVVSRDGRIVSANTPAQELYRCTHAQIVGAHASALCADHDCERLLAEIAMAGDRPSTFSVVQSRADDSSFVGAFSARAYRESLPERVVLIVRETAEACKPKVEDPALRSLMLDHVSDGVVCHTVDGRVLYANRTMLELWGIGGIADACRLGPFGWVMESRREEIAATMAQIETLGTISFESHGTTVGGREVHIEISAQFVRTETGPLVVSSVRDISERLAADEMVRYLAYHDMLTGLANRALLENTLLEAIADAEANDHALALIYLDLNRFKPINDALGHAVGDDVLREVANRIAGCVRETDLVARPGGDEFVVLLPRIRRSEDLQIIAEKIADEVARPLGVSGHSVCVSASVGFAFHKPGEDPESFMIRADLAMYEMRRTNNCPGLGRSA